MLDFEAAYNEYKNSVFRFVLSRVGRREVAEEITQDAFLALWERAESIDKAQLPAWLITVAKNQVIDYFRKLKWEELDPIPEPVVTPNPLPKIWLESLLEIPSLKPIHRVCLILRHAHGMTESEIGEATELTAVQVKGLLQYALRLIREDTRSRSGSGGHKPNREPARPREGRLDRLLERVPEYLRLVLVDHVRDLLSPAEEVCLELRCVEGMTEDEIAQITGIGAVQVENLLERAAVKAEMVMSLRHVLDDPQKEKVS